MCINDYAFYVLRFICSELLYLPLSLLSFVFVFNALNGNFCLYKDGAPECGNMFVLFYSITGGESVVMEIILFKAMLPV